MIPYTSTVAYQQGDLVRLRFAHGYYQLLDVRTSDILIVVNLDGTSESVPIEYECLSSRTNKSCRIMAKHLMKA